VAVPQGPRPLRTAAQGLGRHPLLAGQALAVAVRGHGGEGLEVVLVAPPGPQGEPAAAGGAIEPQARLPDRGVVDLEARAVVPLLVEPGGAEKDSAVLSGQAFYGQVNGRVPRRGRGVDRSPGRGLDGDVAIGAERLRSQACRPAAPALGHEEAALRRLLLAVGRLDRKGRLRGLPAEELDHAPEGGAAIEVRSRAAQHLDPAEGEPGDSAPVDPAAERIVQGDAVRQDQGPARAARPQPPERHPLCRRVGKAAPGTAEEGEAGHLAEGVVDRPGRGGLQLLGGEDDHARRRVGQTALGAGGGDGQLVHDLFRRRSGGLSGGCLEREEQGQQAERLHGSQLTSRSKLLAP